MTTPSDPKTDDATKKLDEAVRRVTEEHNADVVVYCGPLDFGGWKSTYQAVQGRKTKKENVSLFVTTSGGMPDSAYRIAAFLKQSYKGKFSLVVDFYCKSAGTLLAVGADELVLSDIAELGPVDIQLKKPDELAERTSGLTPFQALKALRELAFEDFLHYFLETRKKGLGYITTRTASQVATELVTGLYEPIYAQIDPMRVGEMTRAMTIAHHYGERLGAKNLKDDALKWLISGYPSHSFVIDRAEATKLFKTVRAPSDAETALMALMHPLVEQNVDADEALVTYLLEEPSNAPKTPGHEPPTPSAPVRKARTGRPASAAPHPGHPGRNARAARPGRSNKPRRSRRNPRSPQSPATVTAPEAPK